MFEGIIKKIVSKYLKEYIENLNPDSLKINLLSGNVDLQNLTLKKTALDELNLPIKILFGQIGKIHAKIPWQKLGSSPVVIEVFDIFLVVSPKRNDEYDEQYETMRAQKIKTKKLKDFEQKVKKKRAAEKGTKKPNAFLNLFMNAQGTKKIMEAVINNLQVKVENVHIRYQDMTDPQNPIVFGVTLGEFVIQSCNENWQNVFVKEVTKATYKQIYIRQLAVYSEHPQHSRRFQDIANQKGYFDLMKNGIYDVAGKIFIVSPIDGTLRAVVQKDNLDYSKPRVDASLNFNIILFSFSDRQYRNILNTVHYMVNYKDMDKLKRFKPIGTASTKDMRIKYWKYLVLYAKKSTERKFFSWGDLVKRRAEREEYILLYKKKKKIPGAGTLKPQELKRFQDMEAMIDTDDLLAYREVANYVIDRDAKLAQFMKEKAKQKKGMGITDQDKKEFFKSIGYDEKVAEQEKKIPDDFVELDFKFSIGLGKFNLIDTATNQSIVEGLYQNISTTVKLKENLSTDVQFYLTNLEMYDRFSDTTKFEKIVGRRNLSFALKDVQSKQVPLVDALIQVKPNPDTDASVRVKFEELDVFITPLFLKRMLGFFLVAKTSSDADFSSFKKIAKQQMNSIQQQATTQLKLALENKKAIGLNFEIKAPNLFFPAVAEADDNTSILFFSLGKFYLKTDANAVVARKRKLDLNLKIEESDFYDQFVLKLNDSQVKVINYKQLKEQQFSDDTTQLLQKVDLDLLMEQSIAPTDDTLDRFRINATIPRIKVDLSMEKIKSVISVANSYIPMVEEIAANNQSATKVLESEMLLKGPFQQDINSDWQRFKVELKSNGKIFLYEMHHLKKPKYSIDLKGSKLAEKPLKNEPLCFGVNLPKSKDFYEQFFFKCNELKEYEAWKDKVEFYISDLSTAALESPVVEEDSNSYDMMTDSSNYSDSEAEDGKSKELFQSDTQLLASIHFQLSEIEVNFDFEGQHFVAGKVSQFHLQVQSRKYDNYVHIGIADASVTNLYDKKPILQCIKSPSQNEIVSLNVVQAQKRSSKYNSEAGVTVDISTQSFKAQIDSHLVSKAISILIDLLVTILKINSMTINYKSEELDVLLAQSQTVLDAQTAEQIKNQTVQIKIFVQGAQLSVDDNGLEFANGSVSGIDIDVKKSPLQVDVDMMIEDFEAIHQDEQSKYPKLLSRVEGVQGPLFRLNFHQSNADLGEINSKVLKEIPVYIKDVKIYIQAIQYVFLMRFLKKVQCFIVEGPIWKNHSSLTTITTLANLNDKINLREFLTMLSREQFKKTRLELNASDLRVIIPESPVSTTHQFVGSIAQIKMSNELVQQTFETQGMWFENFSLHVSGGAVEFNSYGNGKSIVSDVSVDMNIFKAVKQIKELAPTLRLDLSVSDVVANVSHEQYQSIVQLIQKNLMDIKGLGGKIKTVDVSQTVEKGSAVAAEVAKEISSMSHAKELKQELNQIDVQVQVSLSSLQLNLLRGRGSIPQTNTLNPLLQAKVSQLYVKHVEKIDKTSTTIIKLGSIAAEDVRYDSKNQFKKIIDSSVKTDGFLKVQLDKLQANSLVVDIDVADPKVTASTNLIIELATFFKEKDPKVEVLGRVEHKLEPLIHKDFLSQLDHSVQLDDHILITDDKPMCIIAQQGVNSNECIIDGNGLSITFSQVKQAPLIFVSDGVTLIFKNVKLKCDKDLSHLVSLGNNAKLQYPLTLGVVERKLKKSSKKVKSSLSSSTPNGNSSEKVSETAVAIKANLGYPSLIFPENDFDANSKYFAIRAKLNAFYNLRPERENGSFLIQELHASLEGGNLSSPFYLVEKISTSINLTAPDLKSDLVQREISINLDSSISLRISYSDIKLIIQIAERLKKQVEDMNANPIENYRTVLPTTPIRGTSKFSEPSTPVLARTTSSFSMASDSDSTFDDDTTSVSSDSSQQIETKPRKEYSLQFIFTMQDYFNFLLVDDSRGYDIPFVQLTVNEVALEPASVLINTQTVELGLEAQLSAKFFNYKLADWEPVLEPTVAVVRFTRAAPVSLNRSTKHFVHSITVEAASATTSQSKTRPINMNISKQMIESIISTVSVWKANLYDNSSNTRGISSTFVPYLIRNHCGKTIKFWIDKETNQKELQYGDEMNLKFDEQLKKISGTSYLRRELLVCVSVDGFPTKLVDVRKVKSIYLESADTFCMIEVEAIDGRKIITVKSGIKVQNSTEIPFDIGISQKNSSAIKKLVTVTPHSTCGVPILDIRSHHLHIKPSQKDSMQWSSIADSNYLINIIKTSSKRTFIFENQTSEGDNCCVVANVEGLNPLSTEEKLSLKQGNRTHLLQRSNHLVTLIAPVALENVLPFSLQYEILVSKNMEYIVIASGTLEKGERRDIFDVSLAENLYLKIETANGWKSNDAELIYSALTVSDMSKQLAVSSNDGAKQSNLCLDYSMNTGAYWEVAIYAPYWLINHTTLPLSISSVTRQFSKVVPDTSQLPKEEPPTLFYSDSTLFSIELSDGSSSPSFSLENIGTSNDLEIFSKTTKNRYNIAYSITTGSGKYNRSKIVKFTSKLIIVNNTDFTILVGEKQDPQEILLSIKPKGRENLLWRTQKDILKELSICTSDKIYKWSSAFKVNSLGSLCAKLISLNSEVIDSLLLNIDIQQQGASVFVVISPVQQAPFIIVNQLSMDVPFSQLGSQTTWVVKKKSKFPYALDVWNGNQKIQLKIKNDIARTIDMNNIKDELKIKINDSFIYVHIAVKDASRMVIISEVSEKKFTKQQANQFKQELLILDLDVKVNAVGVSLIDDRPKEMAYLYIHDLSFSFKHTDKHQFIKARVGKFQLDNQDITALHPVVLCSDEKLNQENGFVNVSVIRSTSEKSTIRLPYVSLLVQQINANVNTEFAVEVANFVISIVQVAEKSREISTLTHVNEVDKVSSTGMQMKKLHFYFEELQIHPIQACITLKLAKGALPAVLKKYSALLFLNNTIGSTFINLDNAKFRLNALYFTELFTTQQQLIKNLITHYTRAGIAEAGKVLGSLEALGNPIGLFNDISGGVKDFFYEPAQAVLKKPENLGLSIVKGTTSLVGNITHGTFNTASKITGTISKGISQLTFDDEYIKSKEKSLNSKASNPLEGIKQGTQGLFKGVFQGVTGVFVKPIKGAGKEGIVGFGKGIFQGVIGLPMKPVAGALELISKTAEGISNLRKEVQKGRKRLARAFGENGLIVDYNKDQATIQFIVQSKYPKSKENVYYYCLAEKEVVCLTENMVICIQVQQRNITWMYAYKDIAHLDTPLKNEIVVKTTDNRSKKLVFGNEKATALLFERFSGKLE